VRVYNRALTAAEVASDMNVALGTADTTAPAAPTNFATTGSTATTIATSWTASNDNVGVAGYRVFLDGAQKDTTQQTTYTFTGLACGSAYTLGVEAYDLAGNTSPRTTLSASAGACDTTPPTVAVSAPAAGSTVSNTVSVTASASDNDRVAGVQFRLDGANLGAEDTTSPYSVSWDTRSVANGLHTLTAIARDGSGNIATSANVAVTVTNSAQPPGLVAAYSFDQGSGTTAPDASGSGNTGTLTNGPTWSSAGKYGGAVSFDGVNDSVTVADSASLDLTSGMTLEAWVRPATTGWPYRTVLMKEQTGNLVYALYLTDATRPLSTAITGGIERIAQSGTALTANTWVHLASTYDGTNLRLYVNGTLVTTTAATGAITVSTGALRIGANSIWTEEAFAGLVDEVRVYNRALTAAEVASDMNAPVAPVP
jgi:chitodextrinase